MVLKERVMFREDQLVKTGDLYRRWACEPFVPEHHTTIEELSELCDDGSLRTYSHVKGPIKGMIYCIPTNGIQLFDGHQIMDEHVDYFLLEDVKRCEKKHPDFLGNPTIGNAPLMKTPLRVLSRPTYKRKYKQKIHAKSLAPIATKMWRTFLA